jgi:hypothetical protein
MEDVSGQGLIRAVKPLKTINSTVPKDGRSEAERAKNRFFFSIFNGAESELEKSPGVLPPKAPGCNRQGPLFKIPVLSSDFAI